MLRLRLRTDCPEKPCSSSVFLKEVMPKGPANEETVKVWEEVEEEDCLLTCKLPRELREETRGEALEAE
jgi:hypothetical protein